MKCRFGVVGIGVCMVMLIAAGCGSGKGSADWSARDSAGVQIVSASVPANGHAWSIEERPVVDISQTGDSALFVQVSNVWRLASGNLLVLPRTPPDSRTGQFFLPTSMLVLDTAGHLVKRIGREGSGPGEFSQIETVFVLPHDTLLVHEPGQLSVMHADGGFSRKTAVEPGKRLNARFSDGSFATFDQSHPKSEADHFHRNTYFRIGPDGKRANAITGPLECIEAGGPYAWNSSAKVAFGDSVLYHTNGREFEISVFSEHGTLMRIIRVDRLPKVTTPADVELFKNRMTDAVIASGGKAPDLSGWVFKDHLAAIDMLYVDSDGDIWVKQGAAWYDDPSDWLIFDPTGHYLGSLTTPASFIIAEIGRDYILGRHSDPEGAQSVRMYRLRR